MASAATERVFSRFIGVDLGGGKGKNTAVALLEVDEAPSEQAGPICRVRYVSRKDAGGRPYHDEQLLAYLEEHAEGALLAVDAPLTRTVCTRCTLPRCLGLEACPDPVIGWFRGPGRQLVTERIRTGAKPPTTPYTQRACEVVLHRRYGILPRETFGQGMGPLTARAHYLCRALEQRFELDRNLIEVYPKATLTRLVGEERAKIYKRSVGTWRTRAEILELLADRLRFDVWREGCLNDDHCFDAVICAYTGFLWAHEGWGLPEEHRQVFEADGWIWFPRPDEGSERVVIDDEEAREVARRSGRGGDEG
jgi:predicted RNase H-like nuclease